MGINDQGRFAHRMGDPMGGSPASGISDEQFDELKRLLHPISHIARMHLKQSGHVEYEDGTWHKQKDEEKKDDEPFGGDFHKEHAEIEHGEGEHAPERDPLDAPEDRDPDKMPAEDDLHQHQAVFGGPEPEMDEEETAAHRQNDLMKARPNQGDDQASLTGGTSMQQNLVETQAKDAEAGPELEGGAASAKDKEAAEGSGAKTLAPVKRTLPGK